MADLLKGVDVSAWQDPDAVNWDRLAEEHYFVIARACYGTTADKHFAEHIRRARAKSLVVGAYLFYRPGEAVMDQLAAFHEAAGVAGFGPGWLLPAVDVEESELYDGPLEAERYSEQCRLICETWSKLHGGAIVYTNPRDWKALGSPDWLGDYRLWIAHWGADAPTTPLGLPWAIWQHRVAPLPGIYARTIDQDVAPEPLPLIGHVPNAADWNEEENTQVTRLALHDSADKLAAVVDEFSERVPELLPLERDTEAETAARDRMVSESDE